MKRKVPFGLFAALLSALVITVGVLNHSYEPFIIDPLLEFASRYPTLTFVMINLVVCGVVIYRARHDIRARMQQRKGGGLMGLFPKPTEVVGTVEGRITLVILCLFTLFAGLILFQVYTSSI